jgi:hypothetical protein
MDRQPLRDWVIRFNERGPDGLVNTPGVQPKFAQGLSRPNRRGGSDPCDPWRGVEPEGREDVRN